MNESDKEVNHIVAEAAIEPAKEEKSFITYEDFLRVDIRIGTILTAERVPKSDKLLKLKVSFGNFGERQIVAGIGKSYTPEEMLGKQIVAVTNLAPRKLMGLESQAMLLAAEGVEKLCLVSSAGAINGAPVG